MPDPAPSACSSCGEPAPGSLSGLCVICLLTPADERPPAAPSGETPERARADAVLRERFNCDPVATAYVSDVVATLASAGLLSSPAQTPEPDAVRALLAKWEARYPADIQPSSGYGEGVQAAARQLRAALAASPAQGAKSGV